MVGHSVGEYSALAAARALSIPEAIALVRERGLATAEAAREHPGSMAAILGLDDEVVEELCGGSTACGLRTTTAPGSSWSRVRRLRSKSAAGRPSSRAREDGEAKVSGAFHSPLVAKAAERLRPAIDRVKFSEPAAPFMSTVSAKLEPAQRMGNLLVDQLTGPVRFTQAARELVKDGVKTFVEVGPGNVLSGLVRRIDENVKAISVNSVPALKKLEEHLPPA